MWSLLPEERISIEDALEIIQNIHWAHEYPSSFALKLVVRTQTSVQKLHISFCIQLLLKSSFHDYFLIFD